MSVCISMQILYIMVDMEKDLQLFVAKAAQPAVSAVSQSGGPDFVPSLSGVGSLLCVCLSLAHQCACACCCWPLLCQIGLRSPP